MFDGNIGVEEFLVLTFGNIDISLLLGITICKYVHNLGIGRTRGSKI